MIESNQDLFPESKRGEWIRLRTMIFISGLQLVAN